MKPARCLALLTLLLVLFLAGCGGGGSKSHDLSTEFTGEVYGAKTVPADSATDAPSDAWVKVYWPDPRHLAPSDFTFRLEEADADGDWHTVLTKLREDKSDPIQAYWWFQPSSSLDHDTWHRILIIDASGQREVAVFRTERSSSSSYSALDVRSGDSSYWPSPADRGQKPSGEGQPEYRISR